MLFISKTFSLFFFRLIILYQYSNKVGLKLFFCITLASFHAMPEIIIIPVHTLLKEKWRIVRLIWASSNYFMFFFCSDKDSVILATWKNLYVYINFLSIANHSLMLGKALKKLKQWFNEISLFRIFCVVNDIMYHKSSKYKLDNKIKINYVILIFWIRFWMHKIKISFNVFLIIILVILRPHWSQAPKLNLEVWDQLPTNLFQLLNVHKNNYLDESFLLYHRFVGGVDYNIIYFKRL